MIGQEETMLRAIEELILDCELGVVVGSSANYSTAYDDVFVLKPDVVIGLDTGDHKNRIHFSACLKSATLQTRLLMYVSPDAFALKEELYDNGTYLCLCMPFCLKELRQFLFHMLSLISLENHLKAIRKLVMPDNVTMLASRASTTEERQKKYKLIFAQLGILGESGCDDLLKMCEFMHRHQCHSSQRRLTDMIKELTDQPNAMEQRMRRTVNKAMTNLASLGVEDYLNETFVKHSNTLFDFEQVRFEMEYLRGNRKQKGKIHLKKFLDNLRLVIEEM